ncbi:MAG TPA: ABC transporter substrate-binding protein [Syntrophomonadaceae bacterium]|nr:ABC transporter substrate-binding protein [Syntrophomonadaceae bacterium]
MKKWTCIILLLAFVTMVVTGCGGGKQAGKSEYPSIVVGLQAEPTTLDPAQMSDYNSTRAGMEMFNNLVEFKDGSTELQPGLAKSWEVSPDGLEYTFHLVEGVKFHDGTPFNADAVKFNVERQIDPNNPYHNMGTFGYAEFTFGMVKEVKVVDQNTVKFILKERFAPFLANLAIPAAAMVSPAAIKKYGKDISQHPVGTGPFKFVKWEPGVNVVVERNPEYWRGAPKIGKIYYRPITDDAARVTELAAGKIDFMVGVLPDDLKRLENDPKLQVQKQAGMHTWYLVMNCSKPPFNDVRVRQAVNYAINKKAIVDNILKGTGTLAKNILPPVIWSYTDDVQDYSYNPEKAKALLKEAGKDKGLVLDFYVPQSGSGMQQPVTMATAIQSDLAAVGIKVNIKQLEWGTYLDKVMQPVEKNDVVLHEMSWIGDNGDPDNFLYILCSGDQWPKNGYNEAFYKNEQVDQILRKARTLTDRAERTRLYQQAQKLIMADSPVVVVDHETQIVVMKKNIKGFKLHPTGVFRFDKVTVE